MRRGGSKEDPEVVAPPRPLATLTHARIRARQGDLSTARRILASILEGDPDHPGARALLAEIGGRPSGASRPAAAAAPSDDEEDGERRIVEHLGRWLDRIKRNAGGPGD